MSLLAFVWAVELHFGAPWFWIALLAKVLDVLDAGIGVR